MFGERALRIGARSAIRQVCGDAPSFAAAARQLSDGVVDARFRASDDHRAAAMAHHIKGGLPTHTGAAADNDDLLGLKVHIRESLPGFLTVVAGWSFFVSTTRNALSRGRPGYAVTNPPDFVVMRLRLAGVSRHHPWPCFPRVRNTPAPHRSSGTGRSERGRDSP